MRLRESRYTLFIMLLVLFAIDLITGNSVTGQAETWEQAYYMGLERAGNREWLPLFAYVTMGLMVVIRPKCDIFDMSLICVFVLSQVITVYDYNANNNWRDVNVDFWAFGILICLITVLKIWNTLTSSHRTRLW